VVAQGLGVGPRGRLDLAHDLEARLHLGHGRQEYTASISRRFFGFRQRGPITFIVYPRPRPRSGSAKPIDPPAPKCPNARGLVPIGRSAWLSWNPSPKRDGRPRMRSGPLECSDVARTSVCSSSSSPLARPAKMRATDRALLWPLVDGTSAARHRRVLTIPMPDRPAGL